MTNSNNEPSRLDRIEMSIEALIGAMESFRSDIHEDLSAMSNAIRILAEEGQRDRENIRTMQAEIRGLQSENRRILDYLLNQQGEQGQDS
jgi:uncharacterized protein Yka (UPF0111/DUF47 family)